MDPSASASSAVPAEGAPRTGEGAAGVAGSALGPAAADPRAPGIDLRRLAMQFLVALIALAALFAAAGLLFQDELLGLGRAFVDTLGPTGIFLGFLVPDATALPVPQDAITALGVVGGMSFWHVVAIATAGSLTGGSLGWLFGRWLRHTRAYRRFVERRGVDAEGLVRRYGVVGLGAAALTPLPYSVVCWACGALEMPYPRFLAVSLLRVVRVAFWLWLIELGLVGAGI